MCGGRNIGVALINHLGDTVLVNGDSVFELCSVVIFHQAVALADKVGYPAIFEARTHVDSGELQKNTWSPMRVDYGDESFDIDLTQLLAYTLLVSDNNAADVIFRRYVAPSECDSLLRLRGLADFGISATEEDMHADPAKSRLNYSTPLSAAKLMDSFFRTDTTQAASVVKAVLSQDSPFGRERIVKGIPEGSARIYHKTGTGFERDGIISAVNDLAFVVFPCPDGSFGSYTLAVFIGDFKGTTQEAEAIIASISAEVWKAMIVDESIAMNGRSRTAAKQKLAVERREADLGEIIGSLVLPFSEMIGEKIADKVDSYNARKR